MTIEAYELMCAQVPVCSRAATVRTIWRVRREAWNARSSVDVDMIIKIEGAGVGVLVDRRWRRCWSAHRG